MSARLTFHTLAPGVMAAIADPGGFAVSNAAIIDLGERTLVLDTTETPVAGAELRRHAEQLFGRPVDALLISHPHGDHWKGTGAFDPATRILSTPATQAAIRHIIDDIHANPSALAEDLARRQQRLAAEADPRWQQTLQRAIARIQHEQETRLQFELRAPDETFEGDFVLEGSARRAEVKHLGHMHSADDCLLVLPDDGIVFLADVGFLAEQPVMRDCDFGAWMAQIDAHLAGTYEVLVPGHGPIGGKAELVRQREYMAQLDSLVAQALQQGGESAARRVEPSAPFDAWLPPSMNRLEGNINLLISRHLSK